jgi:hypothetical protein
MTENASSLLVNGEQVVLRPARALIGWLSPSEAATMLLGRNPNPGENVEAHLKTAQQHREGVGRRETYTFTDPMVDDKRFSSLLADVAKRPEVQATFHGLAWQPAVVDLSHVLSFQKIIFTDGPGLATQQIDTESLTELCLPAEQPLPPTGAITDPDGKSFTISSLNTNLRIAGGQLSEANVSPGPGLPSVRMQAVTLLVSMGTSYMQVVRYRDRWFLRDGYHRASRLLRSGISVVPCIYIEANAFEQVLAGVGAALPYEVLYGDRPPSLNDFWDDSVSSEISQLAIRKVIRIRGEEFAVPR